MKHGHVQQHDLWRLDLTARILPHRKPHFEHKTSMTALSEKQAESKRANALQQL